MLVLLESVIRECYSANINPLSLTFNYINSQSGKDTLMTAEYFNFLSLIGVAFLQFQVRY